MKVIFLDVDGVLNSLRTIRRFGFDFIDPILVDQVAVVVRETGAKIVLSSSWRQDEKDRKLVEAALAISGLEIIGCTPSLSKNMAWVERKEEIRAWLAEHPEVERFAILDDMDDAGIEGSFFQTDENIGLTVAIAERVIQHLR